VKIAGVSHEFSTMPGVLEDVTDIILNIKGLVISMAGESDEPKTMRLAAEGPGEVTAELIEADSSITIHNPEKVIATLTDKRDFAIEFTVQRGRGYMPASEHHKRDEDQEIGVIAVDAIFSPVQRVRYRVEDTRVGQRTNYDKLVLDVWTNGTVSPDMAMVEAAKILRKHLNPFIQYTEPGPEVSLDDRFEQSGGGAVDSALERKLSMSLAELELSVRATNCLETEGITTVRDLVSRSDQELLEVRNFGETTLKEVKEKLEENGLTLGMRMPGAKR